MAQPSVAREPSMEEILASIRRIIESNEPATSDAFSGHLPPVYDDEGEHSDGAFAVEPVSPPSHVPPAANQGYGARQQADFAPFSERNEPVVERPQENTMSLADVAARVRAAADRNAAMGAQAFAAQRPAETAPPQSQPVFQPERIAPAAQRPTDVRPLMAAVSPQPKDVIGDVPSFSSAPAVAPQVPSWENLELRGAVEPEKPSTRTVEVPVESPVLPAVEESALSVNLISAAAGAQIAKSFGELAEVFDGVQRPTIEQLAQDMLRPMLQEWLEDNLPTLVERLVREEIERVARGPRR
ncbi:DUF2497 domain-containing protein [Agrobacterium larrymoorei]|uniref:PopZ family protein n=1 Tax=Agrobacterium larrymoorei TaxID=160699 RepID=UPI001574B013|nr:DUF2497 domain-containing protein [Agrobacterium larrymoorei]NTJ42183.1 DUF2497 domain-containing protein [Agrobacterium larrymoorei]